MTSPVYIVDGGMVSSLGLDLSHSCAAAHAGLVRPSPITGSTDGGSEGIPPLIGHVVPFLTAGRGPLARLVEMTSAALGDLLRRPDAGAPWEARTWSRTALLLALPHPARFPLLAEDLLAGNRAADLVLAPILDRHGVAPAVQRVQTQGPLGALSAISTGATWLHERHVDRVLVAMADSFLDASSIQWLAGLGVLPEDIDAPVFFAPGEAAVCLDLRREPEGGAPLRVDGIDLREQSQPDPIQMGRSLARSVRAAGRDRPVRRYVSDMDGRPIRAKAHGAALGLLGLEEGFRLDVPAVAFGATGTAAPGIALALALHDQSRGCVHDASVLALIDEGRGVGALSYGP